MQNKIIISVLTGFILINAGLIYLALTISPIKLKRTSFVYEYGDKIPTNPDHYVNANESVLENVNLDLSQVSTEVGEYHASIKYFNDKQDFVIKIVDTKKPKVQLKDVQVDINIGERVYARHLIKVIDERSATEVYFYDKELNQKTKSKVYHSEGSYIERIVAEDIYGNQSAVLRVKIVVTKEKKLPEIKGVKNKTIHIGEEFDLLKGVTVYDETEGNITSRLIIEGYVDNQTEGVYPIVYKVYDHNGREVKVVRKITVKK